LGTADWVLLTGTSLLAFNLQISSHLNDESLI
jgi:hypothetical protein